jgi:hypothetical protein
MSDRYGIYNIVVRTYVVPTREPRSDGIVECLKRAPPPLILLPPISLNESYPTTRSTIDDWVGAAVTPSYLVPVVLSEFLPVKHRIKASLISSHKTYSTGTAHD